MDRPKKREVQEGRFEVAKFEAAMWNDGYNKAIDDYEAWLKQSANFKGDNIEQLQAKIDATNKKLKKNRKELWDIQEKNRKLESELIKLIEKKII